MASSEECSSFPPKVYPPTLDKESEKILLQQAIDFALGTGLILRSAETPTHSATHAPFTLFPTPFPKKSFHNASAIQPAISYLMHQLASDHDFLVSVFEKLSKADEFTNRIYQIYLQAKKNPHYQTISLALLRSDYMLHSLNEGDFIPQQVEVNTIASSFGGLSCKVKDLHSYIISQLDGFDQLKDQSTVQLLKKAFEPCDRQAYQNLAKGIATAHDLYHVKHAVTLMVVQPNERNAFDQKLIEYHLLERYGVKMIRRSLSQIALEGKLHNGRLLIQNQEISVVYFRAGYTPDDYPSEEEWKGRTLIECSLAIKSPNCAWHLVGAKKVQQVIARPGFVEKYISDPNMAQQIRSFFTGLYPLDDSPEGKGAIENALQNPSKYVLKPQREGGGNNLYDDEIPKFINSLGKDRSKLSGYILMDKISPPKTINNILVRSGNLIPTSIVSELGIYGIWLSDGPIVYLNEIGGYLLRSKSISTNEGGVAAGYAVIDSPLLLP